MLRLLQSGAPFVAFDTETTGLDYRCCHVIEVGAVKFDKSGVLETFDSFVNIGFHIPDYITSITSITDSMISCAPPLAEVLEDFCSFSGESILLAHNAQFDWNFISQELSACVLPPLKNRIIDTLHMSRWAYPACGKYSLQYLAQALDIRVEAAHWASDDARVCMELFLRIIRDTDGIQKKY